MARDLRPMVVESELAPGALFTKSFLWRSEEGVFSSDTSRGINISINYSQNISLHANTVESSPVIGLSRDLQIDWHDLWAWVRRVSFPSLVAFLAEWIFGQRCLSYFILSTHVDNVPGKINSNINHYGRLWTKSVSITKDSCFLQPLCSACSSNNEASQSSVREITTEFINDNKHEYKIIQCTIYIMQIEGLITNLERERLRLVREL